MSNILILRPDNIGDVVLFSGALRHIRALYPDDHITLAVQEHIVNLVELCPYIDRCIPVEYLTWLGEYEHTEFPYIKHRLKEKVRTINRIFNIISKPFDIIIYPVKSPHVLHLELICRLNAKRVFGITGCNINAPKTGYPANLNPEQMFTECYDVSDADPWIHELHVTAGFLRFLGCQISHIDQIKPQLWLSDTEKNYLDGVRKNGRKIIGLFPGASSGYKCWSTNNYGELARLLGGGLIYVIFGSHADKDLTDRVVLAIRSSGADNAILNVTGLTTLRELAKTVFCCDLVISMDTSGLHISIASNVPSVGIVGGGHFGRFIPWGNPENLFLTKKMECFHCNWVCTKDYIECVNGVSVQEVVSAVKSLL